MLFLSSIDLHNFLYSFRSSFVGKIQRIAEDMNATITNTEYLEKVSFTIQIEAGSSIEKKIIEGTNGKATVTKNCDLLIEIPI